MAKIVFAVKHFYLAVGEHYHLSLKIFKSIRAFDVVMKTLFVETMVTVATIIKPTVTAAVRATAVSIIPFE